MKIVMRWMLVLCACTSTLVSAQEEKPASSPVVDEAAVVPPAATPEQIYAAWLALPEKDRLETVEWFVAECDRSTTFRSQLERYIIGTIDESPSEWPAAGDPPRFTAEEHAPAQIIDRNFVNVKRGGAKKAFERLRRGVLKRGMTPAFTYDWGRGEIVVHMARHDAERVARNATLGFGPDTDLAQAIVARMIDDHSFATHAAAFSHAYSDRNGGAFREITLYQAWCSGAELEMPDVECLGIYHMLEDDWKTFVAPVRVNLQNRLYSKIAKHFRAYRKFRDLRTSLALTYLQANPKLPTGYAGLMDKLHGTWELHMADPTSLAPTLPTNDEWKRWIDRTGNKVTTDKEIVARRIGRIKALVQSEDWARRTFRGILAEYGAFDPKEPAEATEPPLEGAAPPKGSGKQPGKGSH